MLRSLELKFKTYKHKALNSLEVNTELTIYAIKPTKTKYNDTYLLLCEDAIDSDFNCVVYANTTLKSYVDKVINSFNVNKQLIYFLEEAKTYILKVLIKDVYTYEGNKCVRLDIKSSGFLTSKFVNIVQEQETTKEEIKNDLLEFLDPIIREKTCIKLDDMEEGKKYFITHLTKKKGNKDKYIFKVENDDNVYISTTFLEEALNANYPTTKFYLTVGIFKVDKSKKKHRTVYI